MNEPIRHTPSPWQLRETDDGFQIRMGTAIDSYGSYEAQHIVENIFDGIYPQEEEDGEADPETLQYLEAQANARLMASSPDLLTAIRDQIAWIERHLQNLEGRIVSDRKDTPVNSFAGAFVPDWEMRQKLESLKEDVAKATGGTV